MLLLDFDGVLCDSARECAFSGYNAFATLEDMPLAARWESIPEHMREGYSTMRPFVRSGADYVLIFMLLSRGIVADSQDRFDEFARASAARRGEYAAAMDSQRRSLLAHEPEYWLSLNPLFGIPGLLSTLSDPATRILTTKRKEYVQRILAHHGLPMDPERILSVNGQDKIAVLGSLISAWGIPPDACILIDDQTDHVLRAQRLGVHAYLATWGYVHEQQMSLARSAGVMLLDIEGIGSALSRFQR